MRVKIKIDRNFWNNAPDTYRARLEGRDGDMLMLNIKSEIDRMTREDAMIDGQAMFRELTEENGFRAHEPGCKMSNGDTLVKGVA